MRTITQRTGLAFAALLLLTRAGVFAADDPSKLPVVDANDAAAIAANMDKDIFLRGSVTAATWSDTGKVMNVFFKGVERGGVRVVAFSQSRKRLDEAFNGDVAKTLIGANVRIRGRLREYAAKGTQKGYPEVTISDPSQITIVIDDAAKR